MSKYDVDTDTPISVLKQRLEDARTEKRIYIIANLIRVIHSAGYTEINLKASEKKELLDALKSIRAGKKILPYWLPIGYQTARFLSLAKELSGKKVSITKRDLMRIRNAARYYRKINDWHSRRQLRSLINTANYIGLNM